MVVGLCDECGLLGVYGGLIGVGVVVWVVISGFCVGG